MGSEKSVPDSNRREFLLSVAPAGAMACLGCERLWGLMQSASSGEQGAQHKFEADSQMSFQDVYSFAFAGGAIPLLRSLGEEGQDGDYLERLKRASARAGDRQGRAMATALPDNSFAAFTSWAKEKDRFWEHVLTVETIEDTDSAFEIKVTECLWAKTFRENDAADIGYATICHPDFAMCQAFNPKIRMERTTTLMEGHDCCNHRWILEG